jgi:hypothetical protein
MWRARHVGAGKELCAPSRTLLIAVQTMAQDRRISLRWVVQQMYHRMKNRAKKKNLELLPQEVFMEMALADDRLKEIHDKWIYEGFPIRLSPSVDRINNDKGYIQNNIQFLTHSHNVIKGNRETGRSGEQDTSGQEKNCAHLRALS